MAKLEDQKLFYGLEYLKGVAEKARLRKVLHDCNDESERSASCFVPRKKKCSDIFNDTHSIACGTVESK